MPQTGLIAKQLEGRIAVIRWNSGIGLATAQRFVQEGVYVFITGRRQNELDKAVKQIGSRQAWVFRVTSQIGSNSFCFSCSVTFGNDPFQYRHHEEQYLTNPNDIVLLNYDASTSIKQMVRPLIATYELNYQKGKVVALGIYSDDIIANPKFNKYFDSLLVKYAPRNMAPRIIYIVH